jgi:hypothetical protein
MRLVYCVSWLRYLCSSTVIQVINSAILYSDRRSINVDKSLCVVGVGGGSFWRAPQVSHVSLAAVFSGVEKRADFLGWGHKCFIIRGGFLSKGN